MKHHPSKFTLCHLITSTHVAGFSPDISLRQSGWAWFGWSLWPHQTIEVTHQRKTSMEGMGGGGTLLKGPGENIDVISPHHFVPPKNNAVKHFINPAHRLLNTIQPQFTQWWSCGHLYGEVSECERKPSRPQELGWGHSIHTQVDACKDLWRTILH